MKMVKKQRFKGVLIILFAIIVVALYILIYFVPNIGDTFQKTQIAVYDSIQVNDVLDFYVIRDETVVFSKEQGSIKYSVSEGERVKKSSEILEIDSNSPKVKSVSEIAEINEIISVINSGENVFENDLKNIDKAIKNIIIEMTMEKDNGNIYKVRELAERFNKIIEKRSILLNNRRLELLNPKIIDNDSTIVESMLNSNVNSYKSANPGVISYCIDGYETEFNPATMYLLKKEEMDKISGQVESIYRDYAFEQEPVYKLINTHEWYTAAWIDNSNLDKYDVGNKIGFNLPEGKVEGVVHDIMQDDNYSLVIIRINEYYPEFWKIRKIKAQIVALNFEGLKINNESIVVLNGVTGVFVSDIDNNFEFTPISIIGSNSKYTIIESNYFYEKTDEGNIKVNTVDLYDEILRNGQSKLENRS